MKKVLNVLAMLMLMAGFVLLSWPFLCRLSYNVKSDNAVNEFKERYNLEADGTSSGLSDGMSEGGLDGNAEGSSDEGTDGYSDGLSGEASGGTMKYQELYLSMKDYNQKIYADRQSELSDAFSYTTNDFDFLSVGLTDDMIGYITIPAMDIELPLYIGANRDNLANGAAVLSKTSMPIGGYNTNTVIAGHRGWRGTDMFVNIEKLKVGDPVYITNLWGTLNYKVCATTVIAPNDIEKIKIFEGQELVTLVTCHPYHHNYQRYVVYCVRDYGTKDANDGNIENDSSAEDSFSEMISADDGMENFESSEEDIENNYFPNIIGLILIGLILVYLTVRYVRRKMKSQIDAE